MVKQRSAGYFRRQSWDGQLSLEHLTERVPNDSRYYILVSGEIVATYRRQREATAEYERLLPSFPPPPSEDHEDIDPAELRRRERDQKAFDRWLEFWADKDGKGRREKAPGRYR